MFFPEFLEGERTFGVISPEGIATTCANHFDLITANLKRGCSWKQIAEALIVSQIRTTGGNISRSVSRILKRAYFKEAKRRRKKEEHFLEK